MDNGEESEELDPEYIEYLLTELQRGVDQLDRGERAVFDAESIIAEGRAQLGTIIRPSDRQ